MSVPGGRRVFAPITLFALLALACPATDPGASSVSLAPTPSPWVPSGSPSPADEIPGPVDVNYHHRTKVEHYRVNGSTTGQIYAQIQQRGPGRYAGEASSQLTYDPLGEYAPSGRCHLKRVVVNLDVTLTLPRWHAPAGASGATRAYWNRTSTVLERHERGHEKIYERYARRLVHELTDVRAAVSCAKLYRRADDRADRVFSALNRANRRYDSVTDHGLDQAAG